MEPETFQNAWSHLVNRLRNEFGFGDIMYGVIVRPIGRDDLLDRSVGYYAFSDGFPEEVRAMYADEKTIHHDYAARHCVLSRDVYHWYTDIYEEIMNDEEKKRDKIYAAHNLIVGMTLPLGPAAEPDFCLGGLGLASACQPDVSNCATSDERLDATKEERLAFRRAIRPHAEAIREIGRQFHLLVFRTRLLGGILSSDGGKLTFGRDERLVLEMKARGFEYCQILSHLESPRSEKSLRRHAHKNIAKELFKVNNIEAAIANAVRLNII